MKIKNRPPALFLTARSNKSSAARGKPLSAAGEIFYLTFAMIMIYYICYL